MEVRNEEMKPHSDLSKNRKLLLLLPVRKVVSNTITGLTENGIAQM